MFARLGVSVTVLEAMPHVLPAEDPTIGITLGQYLEPEGLAIHAGVRVERVSHDTGGFSVAFRDVSGSPRQVKADELLVATGRRANTTGFGLEELGVQLGSKGEVVVDSHLMTSVPGVYAAGDVIGDPMLVYVAAHAGALAAENALIGDGRRYDLAGLPRVTFTDPAVASVGMTESEAISAGIEVAATRMGLEHVPRAQASRDQRGFIALVAERTTRRIIGAQILAAEAGELIVEPTLAIKHGLTIDDLTSTFHPYLTASEGIRLAAQTFDRDVSTLSCCAA